MEQLSSVILNPRQQEESNRITLFFDQLQHIFLSNQTLALRESVWPLMSDPMTKSKRTHISGPQNDQAIVHAESVKFNLWLNHVLQRVMRSIDMTRNSYNLLEFRKSSMIENHTMSLGKACSSIMIL
jgi:hypothetical protein